MERERLLPSCTEDRGRHQINISVVGRPDHGKAWLIAVACCWVTLVSYGFFMASGVFFIAFKDTFHVSREEASWPLTLLFASLSLSAPAIAVICQYFSLRTVSTSGCVLAACAVSCCYFAQDVRVVSGLFGVLQGLGYSLLTNPAFLIVNLYFKEKRVMANGIQQAGGSLGCFVFPPLMNAIITKFGLHVCFLFMGAIILTSFVAALSFVPPEWLHSELNPISRVPQVLNIPQYNTTLDVDDLRTDQQSRPDDLYGQQYVVNVINQRHSLESPRTISKWKTAFAILSHPAFWVIQMVYVCLGVGLPLYGQVFIDYAADKGISNSLATYFVSASSVLDLTGRLGTGWITDMGFLKRKTLVAVMCLYIGTMCIVMPFIQAIYVFAVMSASLGFAGGTLVALVHVVHAEYFGLDNLVLTIALAQFISGSLSLLSPYVIGYFRDQVGSYEGLLFLVGSLAFATLFGWLLEPLIIKRWPKMSEEDNDPERA